MNAAIALAEAFIAAEATSDEAAARLCADGFDPVSLLRGPGAPRVLFAVTEHADGFRAIVSDRRDPEGFQYGIALTLAGSPLQVAGWASADPFVPDGQIVWAVGGGRQVTGPPTAATKLRRPEDPDSAADYDALPG